MSATHTAPTSRVRLDAAARSTEDASVSLAIWHGTTRDAARVRAGHDAISAIDTALRALHDAREALVTEIHHDNIERAARVDELLARVRAERFGHPDGWTYRREAEDQAADDEPPRPGVEGWTVGRAPHNGGTS